MLTNPADEYWTDSIRPVAGAARDALDSRVLTAPRGVIWGCTCGPLERATCRVSGCPLAESHRRRTHLRDALDRQSSDRVERWLASELAWRTHFPVGWWLDGVEYLTIPIRAPLSGPRR